jgi:hypothetical protein
LPVGKARCVMENALLLVEPSERSAASRLEKVLAVFGVAGRQLSVSEFSASAGAGDDKIKGDEKSKFRLLSSSATFLKLLEALGKNSEASSRWQNDIHSAFVFAENDRALFEKLARQITGNSTASLVNINRGAVWSVSDQLPEFCKSMSGLLVADINGAEAALAFNESNSDAVKIISTKTGVAFVRLGFRSVPVFLSTADIIDVDAALLARYFDVRRHFLAAVPVVLYVKWAFSGTCWQAAKITACLVIDDPLLKSRYGFLNFHHLLNLMEHVDFSTSIAFIPWNWSRSARKIVRLFQENPKRFSLSIHGCDHTDGEFGSRDSGRLAWKSKLAMQRMARHQSTAGLAHDPVMVFPQGVFSEAAMAVLKRSGFIGVVNSEVISTDSQLRPIKIADYWNVAVMNYSEFPIFTRRYPSQGIENFAFDVLVGKPCIVVVHHNDCYDDCRHVVKFIEHLNKLNVELVWTNLAEVVRRSFRQREVSPNVIEIEMYGSEVWIENPSGEKKFFRFRKREAAPAIINEIRVAAQPVKWAAAGNHVTFEVELNPGENKMIAFTFNEPANDGFAGENLRYKAKTMLRRVLCEARDNYLSRLPPPETYSWPPEQASAVALGRYTEIM